MKYYIKTFGCQMNVYDSQRIARILQNMGHTPAASPAEAGLIIFNTCHIREKAAEKLFSDLGRINLIKEERKAAGLETIIGVVGCVVQAEDGEIARRAPFVNFATGPLTYYRIPEILQKIARDKDLCIIDTEFTAESKFDHLPENRSEGACSYLAVQEGCNNFCTYCIVPYTRGVETSRPVEDVLKEARRLVETGTLEINLLGQNVNSYHGEDAAGKERDLAYLLRRLAEIDGLERLRYTTSYPADVNDDLIACHREIKKLMPYLHLPLQSGSSQILKVMNRHYTKEQYLELVEKIRKAVPDIALTTDIIVGFPGETEEDFEETMDVVRRVRYDSAFTFIYSKRTGTPAAKMENQVPEDVVKARFDRLLAEVQKISSEVCGRDVHTVQKVLVEELDDHVEGYVTGRMSNNTVVHFPGNADLIGKIVDVYLEESKGFYYMGKQA